jgi:hypothetical protein
MLFSSNPPTCKWENCASNKPQLLPSKSFLIHNSCLTLHVMLHNHYSLYRIIKLFTNKSLSGNHICVNQYMICWQFLGSLIIFISPHLNRLSLNFSFSVTDTCTYESLYLVMLSFWLLMVNGHSAKYGGTISLTLKQHTIFLLSL